MSAKNADEAQRLIEEKAEALVNFVAGDILKIVAPDSIDATAAGFACSLNGTRS
jgi:hypothetical protein